MSFIEFCIRRSSRRATRGKCRPPPFENQTLLSVFTDLPRPGGVRVGALGRVMTARQAAEVLEAGCDLVMLGKAAILDPDMPKKAGVDEDYRAPGLPVTAEYFKSSGLSERSVEYMRPWEGFVLNGQMG